MGGAVALGLATMLGVTVGSSTEVEAGEAGPVSPEFNAEIHAIIHRLDKKIAAYTNNVKNFPDKGKKFYDQLHKNPPLKLTDIVMTLRQEEYAREWAVGPNMEDIDSINVRLFMKPKDPRCWVRFEFMRDGKICAKASAPRGKPEEVLPPLK